MQNKGTFWILLWETKIFGFGKKKIFGFGGKIELVNPWLGQNHMTFKVLYIFEVACFSKVGYSFFLSGMLPYSSCSKLAKIETITKKPFVQFSISNFCYTHSNSSSPWFLWLSKSDIFLLFKRIRTDTTLDLSQKAKKRYISPF